MRTVSRMLKRLVWLFEFEYFSLQGCEHAGSKSMMTSCTPRDGVMWKLWECLVTGEEISEDFIHNSLKQKSVDMKGGFRGINHPAVDVSRMESKEKSK
jgi:hypothetical protein